jgi:hypothetical protein
VCWPHHTNLIDGNAGIRWHAVLHVQELCFSGGCLEIPAALIVEFVRDCM